MIIEGAQAAKLSPAACAGNVPRFRIPLQNLARFFATMNPHKVRATVSLVATLKGAVPHRAAMLLRFLSLSVAGFHMDFQCLCMNKLLMTCLAFKLHLLFVCFHMVMHGRLIFLYNAAGRAHKLPVLISNINHTGGLGGRGP